MAGQSWRPSVQRNDDTSAPFTSALIITKQGDAICSINLEVRQDILDSAILHAMTKALDGQVLEASVKADIERIRYEQEKLPDHR